MIDVQVFLEVFVMSEYRLFTKIASGDFLELLKVKIAS